MLTEGFLRGWLTFDNKTPFSALREEFILTAVERHLFLDITKTKIQAAASVVSGNPTRQSVSTLGFDITDYFELTLPYLSEKTKIRNSSGDKAQLNDPTFWRGVLEKKKKEIATQDPLDVAVLVPEVPESIG